MLNLNPEEYFGQESPTNTGWHGLAGSIGDFFSDITGATRDREEARANMLAQMKYDQALTNAQWEREDTAISRAVADYKNAGLNPLLAVGGKGFASSAPTTQNYGGMVNEALAKSASIRAGGFDQLTGFMQGALNMGMSMAKLDAELKESDSRINYQNKLSDKVTAEAGRIAGLSPYEIENFMIRNKLLTQQYDAYEKIGKTRDTVDLNIARANLTKTRNENNFWHNTIDTRERLFNSQISDSTKFKWDQIESWANLGASVLGRLLGLKYTKQFADNDTYRTLQMFGNGAFYGERR